MLCKKNIKHGKKDRILFFIFFIIFLNISTKIFSEEKISSSPLINMDQIKPSFEEVEDQEDNMSSNQNIKQKETISIWTVWPTTY